MMAQRFWRAGDRRRIGNERRSSGGIERLAVMQEDEHAIRTLIDTWMAATKAGDPTTILDLMTDDVVFMVPGREPFGKQEFAAMSRSQQGVRFDGKADIRELRVSADWAFARTFLKVAAQIPGGSAAVERSGYTLTIFRKESDGRWRLARDANLLTAKDA
jgi:uncharacterized protein (TIGR02246 family)